MDNYGNKMGTVSHSSIYQQRHLATYANITATTNPLPHTPVRTFNYPLARKYSLAEHTKTHTKTRTGEKPHVCPVRTCGKSFSTSGNLSRHKRQHGYIEPLPCPVVGCVCTFASNNKLAKHMKFHYGSDDVRVCVVAGCGKTFSTTGNLNRHLKTTHSENSMNLLKPASPNATSRGSPTAAEHWEQPPYFASEVPSEQSWLRLLASPRASASMPLPPIAMSAEELWDADLIDALSSLFDDHHNASSMSVLLHCNADVLQRSLHFRAASSSFRC